MDIDGISEINRWWTDDRVPEHLSKRIKRDLFPSVWNMMDKRQIISIMRLRRVGKSTLMFQLIGGLIKDTDLVRELLKIFSSNPGMIVDHSSLGDDLGISRQTVSKYLIALLSAYSLIRLYSYHRNFLTSSKKAKRIYPAHPCIMESFYGEMDPPGIGRIVENVVVSYLDPGFFYRVGKKEIDMIIRDKERPVPVEVKYSSRIGEKELRTISWFLEKRDHEMGIVATKDVFERRGKILLMPVFILLSMENPVKTCKNLFHDLE